jgi:hypothetical protein
MAARGVVHCGDGDWRKKEMPIMWKHVPFKETAYAVAFLTLLSAAYVSAYYLCVTRQEIVNPSSINWPSVEFETVPAYPIGGNISKHFFSAWHQLDRRIRPAFWSERLTP